MKVSIFSSWLKRVCNILFLSLIAPCLSNGCGDCDDTVNCGYIPHDACLCTSSCYGLGFCCPDIFHVENCFSELASTTIYIYIGLN